METHFLLAFGEEEFLAPLAMTGSEAFFNKLLEVSAGIDSDLAAAVRIPIERAFIFGFRFITVICAGLSLASAAVAWRMTATLNLNNR